MDRNALWNGKLLLLIRRKHFVFKILLKVKLNLHAKASFVTSERIQK